MFWKSLVVASVAAACSGGSGNNVIDGPHGGSDAGDAPVDGDPSCATPGVLPALKAQSMISSGLTKPIYVAQPPGSTDLYIVEEAGHIKILRNGALLPTNFLDIPDTQLPPDGEGGLLSIAFHPDYATNGRFFTYATVTENNLAVVREYSRSANPDIATPTPVGDLISQPNDGNANMGGTILFGPDHYMWISAGDGGNAPESADLTSRRGKLLRIDVDQPTVAPPGNLGTPADPFIWDYGLRNPFRMSFDRKTGELYIGDAGNDKFEEVDIEQPNMGNKDYGWPRMEGDVCEDGSNSCMQATATLPQYVRAHQVAYSVIIGGSVYRGGAMPCLRGHYIYAIFGTEGHILTWQWDGTTVSPEVDLTDMLNIDLDVVGVNEDQAGELYLVTLGGKVYKLVPG
jgi:glucose/arabinose dehydrogenase